MNDNTVLTALATGDLDAAVAALGGCDESRTITVHPPQAIALLAQAMGQELPAPLVKMAGRSGVMVIDATRGDCADGHWTLSVHGPYASVEQAQESYRIGMDGFDAAVEYARSMGSLVEDTGAPVPAHVSVPDAPSGLGWV